MKILTLKRFLLWTIILFASKLLQKLLDSNETLHSILSTYWFIECQSKPLLVTKSYLRDFNEFIVFASSFCVLPLTWVVFLWSRYEKFSNSIPNKFQDPYRERRQRFHQQHRDPRRLSRIQPRPLRRNHAAGCRHWNAYHRICLQQRRRVTTLIYKFYTITLKILDFPRTTHEPRQNQFFTAFVSNKYAHNIIENNLNYNRFFQGFLWTRLHAEWLPETQSSLRNAPGGSLRIQPAQETGHQRAPHFAARWRVAFHMSAGVLPGDSIVYDRHCEYSQYYQEHRRHCYGK